MSPDHRSLGVNSQPASTLEFVGLCGASELSLVTYRFGSMYLNRQTFHC